MRVRSKRASLGRAKKSALDEDNIEYTHDIAFSGTTAATGL